MEYQTENSIEQSKYELKYWEPFSFPPHLHRFLELTYLMEGELDITISGVTERMRAGDMAFVFPNHPHSYSRHAHNKAAVFIIGNDYIPSVAKIIDHSTAEHYVFTPEKEVTELLSRVLLTQENPDIWEIKSTIYLLMHSFLKNNKLEKNNKMDADLLQHMLSYVSERFNEDITMKDMAAELGYDRQYLSRKFNQMVNVNFRTYLNLYRIDYACTQLKETKKSITAICMESGFQNMRSFNRSFLNATGEQPMRYRQHYQSI